MSSNFPITDKTEITRLAKRGSYDKETIYSILDEALFCNVAFNLNGQPFQIPTGFCRIDDKDVHCFVFKSRSFAYFIKVEYAEHAAMTNPAYPSKKPMRRI